MHRFGRATYLKWEKYEKGNIIVQRHELTGICIDSPDVQGTFKREIHIHIFTIAGFKFTQSIRRMMAHRLNLSEAYLQVCRTHLITFKFVGLI